LPDGTLIEGVEVFRRLYSAVGLSAVVAITRLPGLSQLFDLAYRLFARHRLRLTGRCRDGACEVHQKPTQGPPATKPLAAIPRARDAGFERGLT
jgi:predicted DCC family thiol-disulfide oxidoreductase YuxK